MFTRMKHRTAGIIFVLGAATAALAAWFFMRAPERVPAEYQPSGSFGHYRRALLDISAAHSELGARWLAAGDEVFEGAVDESSTPAAALPLSETVIFDPAEPEAAAYRFNVPRRRELVVSVEPDVNPPLFFADLYRLSPNGNGPPQKVASLDPQEGVLRIRTRRAGTYLFRLQPEIARGGRVRVHIDDR